MKQDPLVFEIDPVTGAKLTAAAIGCATTPRGLLTDLVRLVTDPDAEITGLPQLTGGLSGERVLVRARVGLRTLARLADAAEREGVGVAALAGRLVASVPPFGVTAAARAERLSGTPSETFDTRPLAFGTATEDPEPAGRETGWVEISAPDAARAPAPWHEQIEASPDEPIQEDAHG